jgi:hypothetical protein
MNYDKSVYGERVFHSGTAVVVCSTLFIVQIFASATEAKSFYLCFLPRIGREEEKNSISGSNKAKGDENPQRSV